MAISVHDAVGAGFSAGVRSETGKLRRVLVHRPGAELDRLTPANAGDLLFDDVVWPDLARREHDALTAALAEGGAEVLHLTDLLAGALRAPAARSALIEAACAPLGEAAREQATARLHGLDERRLAFALIEGDSWNDAGRDADAVQPLVNTMFLRDTSAWLGSDLVLGGSSNPIRARETRGVEAIYRHHALFSRSRPSPILAPEIEGGDLMCLNDRSVLIGVGSRSSSGGAQALARALFERGFERVLAVPIPAERSSIHLDCLMTIVDRDAALIDRRLLHAVAVELCPTAKSVTARPGRPLQRALAEALGVRRLRVIEVAGEREQWTLGANTLAVEPGTVIALSRNARTNAALQAAGIRVLAIPGEELSRGRGGPRCLTCPLSRDPVDAP